MINLDCFQDIKYNTLKNVVNLKSKLGKEETKAIKTIYAQMIQQNKGYVKTELEKLKLGQQFKYTPRCLFLLFHFKKVRKIVAGRIDSKMKSYINDSSIDWTQVDSQKKFGEFKKVVDKLKDIVNKMKKAEQNFQNIEKQIQDKKATKSFKKQLANVHSGINNSIKLNPSLVNRLLSGSKIDLNEAIVTVNMLNGKIHYLQNIITLGTCFERKEEEKNNINEKNIENEGDLENKLKEKIEEEEKIEENDQKDIEEKEKVSDTIIIRLNEEEGQNETLKSIQLWKKKIELNQQKIEKRKPSGTLLLSGFDKKVDFHKIKYSNDKASKSLKKAIEENNFEKVKSLLSEVTADDINYRCIRDGLHGHSVTISLFELAAYRAGVEIVSCLAEHGGCDFHTHDPDEYTALYYACNRMAIDNKVIKYLLEEGADPHRCYKDSQRLWKSKAGRSLLIGAIFHEKLSFDLIKLLIEYAPEPEAFIAEVNQVKFYTTAETAFNKGSVEVFEYLLLHGGEFNAFFTDPFRYIQSAVQEGHLDLIKFLHENGVDLRFVYKGLTLLHSAFLYDRLDIALYLINEVGIDSDIKTKDTEFPGLDGVKYAQEKRNYDVLDFYRESLNRSCGYESYGAPFWLKGKERERFIINPNYKFEGGNTILHLYMKQIKNDRSHEFKKRVELFLEKGADPTLNNAEKQNAFQIGFSLIKEEEKKKGSNQELDEAKKWLYSLMREYPKTPIKAMYGFKKYYDFNIN